MVMMYLKELVQLDLLVFLLNNMRSFGLEDLCKFLQIPETEIAKFLDVSMDLDIMEVKKLFHEDEDGFFEILEENYNPISLIQGKEVFHSGLTLRLT